MSALPIDWSNPVVEAALLALHVLLAGTVTIDVLLKKSEVRTALGWMALAWLSPIIGAAFYYLFGINRVTRRALKMGRGADKGNPGADLAGCPAVAEHMMLLTEAGKRITGANLAPGNSLQILRGGDETYPRMLEAIRNARHSVAISSYIFRYDAAGRQFAEALIAAHQRGVVVRVLLDGVGVGYFAPGILYALRGGGVRVAQFLHTWMPWRMPFLNMRNHRKLLIADGCIGFVGGINIGIENCPSLWQQRRVQDVHFRVEGPIVRVMMESFARDWGFTTDELLEQDIWWPALEPRGQVFARGLSSGPDADLYKIEMILGAALALARKRVRIVTPYFLPDPRLQFAIAQAGLRGVAVEIVLPAVSDQRIMQWAMRGHLRFFRHVRARFFSSPPPFDHTKLCTVDGEWSLIGSSNWDARSFRLNFEFDLECVDRDFTAQLDAMIDAKIAAATVLTPEMLAAEPLWKRLRNAAARLFMPYL